jgi:PKD repeat protein
MVRIVKYNWYFGDGSSSTDPSPSHTYTAPGIYYPSLVATDEYGNIYTASSAPIYVYDYDLGGEGLRSGYSDACFRLALKPSQGQGIVPYAGKWLWPMMITGTAKGINNKHEAVSLVINSEDMKIYRIGVPEVWVDREGSYDESEIATEVMLPEITSRSGEHENVRHIETHLSVRSWDELRYRGAAGYTPEGQRDAQEYSIEAFKGGEQLLPTTKLRKVNLEGDYALLKEVEARRIQLKIKTATSAFRITRVGVHAQEIDKRTPPHLNYVPEKAWQKEFASPDMWFSTNKPSIQTNRGDAVVWTGAAAAVTDPAGKNKAFLAPAGLSGTLGYSISDFSISGWIYGDGKILECQVAGGGVFTLEVLGGMLLYTDGTDTVQIMLAGTGWIQFAAVRTGNNLELYENGLLKTSQALTGVRSFGGAALAGSGMLFDLRRNLKTISSDAMKYYYDSILDGSGGFLP